MKTASLAQIFPVLLTRRGFPSGRKFTVDPVFSNPIGYSSRLEASSSFSTNHIRERFSGGTVSSAFRFCLNPGCFPLWFVFIRLNREHRL